MKYLFSLKIALMTLLLCGSISMAAQGRGGKATFSGYVYAVESGSGGVTTKPEPLAYATVYLPDVGLFATTADDGYFEITDIDAGKYTVEISSLGYEDFSQQIAVYREQVQSGEKTLDDVLPEAEHLPVLSRKFLVELVGYVH